MSKRYSAATTVANKRRLAVSHLIPNGEEVHPFDKTNYKYFLSTGIYEISCIVDRSTYIGSSLNIPNKLDSHIAGIGSNKILQNKLNRYGLENFAVRVLEFMEPEQNLSWKESYYIPNSYANSLVKKDQFTFPEEYKKCCALAGDSLIWQHAKKASKLPEDMHDLYIYEGYYCNKHGEAVYKDLRVIDYFNRVIRIIPSGYTGDLNLWYWGMTMCANPLFEGHKPLGSSYRYLADPEKFITLDHLIKMAPAVTL